MTSLNRRYLAFVCGLLLFVLGMAYLDAIGLARKWQGAIFLIATVLAYAAIGFSCRTSNETEFFMAGRRVPAMYNGMATAADWMSAASFIGTAGVLYLQGFAGLAYILGWTGGYCLLAFFLVPYLRRFGQYTVPDFLGARYGGDLARIIGALAVMLVSSVYLVAQIYGVGLIASQLTGVGFELGILVGLGGVLVCSFLGGMRAVTWTQVAQYIVLIVAYLVPLVWLSVKQATSAVPAVSYEAKLDRITAKEQALKRETAEARVAEIINERAAQAARKLTDVRAAMAEDKARATAELERRLAEGAPVEELRRLKAAVAELPRTEAQAQQVYQRAVDARIEPWHPLPGLQPLVMPFPQGDPQGSPESRGRFKDARNNFIALMLCLMVGTAAMPHLLMRFQTTISVRDARRSVAWSLAFIVLLYLAAPAMAVLVKQEIFERVIGLPFDKLPGWLTQWAKLNPDLVSFSDINRDGILQLGELNLAGDVIVLAGPEIAGLPYFVTCLVAAGGLAAALSTADGLLMTLASAMGHDLYFKIVNPKAKPIQRVLLAKLLILGVAAAAAAVASAKVSNIVVLVSAAFSLAGSAFFPALVLGIFWRRANRQGAVASMVVGLSVSLYYMATNFAWPRHVFGVLRPVDDCRWFGIDPLAAGIFGVPAGVLALILVSLLTPGPTAEQRALVDRLRVPQGPGG